MPSSVPAVAFVDGSASRVNMGELYAACERVAIDSGDPCFDHDLDPVRVYDIWKGKEAGYGSQLAWRDAGQNVDQLYGTFDGFFMFTYRGARGRDVHAR